MKTNIWIMNHYAGGMFFNRGGRHYSFAKYLRQEGYAPVVFCCNAKHSAEADRYFEDDSLWHEHIAEEIDTPFVFVRARTYTNNGKQRVLNMVDFYRNVKKAAKQYAAQHGKPDIIYASSVHPLTLVAGIQLAKYFGVKCICEARDLWPESIVAYSTRFTKSDPLIRLLYQGERWIYKKADAVVMTWPGGYDYIEDQGWDKDIPREKVFHINNGVDLATFQENMSKCVYDDADLKRRDVKKFVYTGSIRKVNNIRMLVDAAEILQQRGVSDAVLLIWGAGDELESLTQLAAEKQLHNIVFKGRAPKSAIPSILQQADVSVLHNARSILDKYGQSQNKFFEYLAVGHPVLMTYSVGHSICKAASCGIELDAQTPASIADAIEQMVSMPEDAYQTMSANARRTAEDYDFKRLTKKLISVIEER